MYGHDGSAMRSRYDYYYSVSSPSLSQATNYFENQHASLFGDPVLPLLSQPVQQLPIPQLPLPPPNTITSSSTATYLGSGYTGAVATPLIDNFDQHLYESIRRNFLDHQNNNNNNITSTSTSNVGPSNNNIADSLNKAQLWHQQSTSSSDSPPPEEYEITRKRAGSAMSSYNHYDDGSYEFSPSKFSRALSAHSGSCRNLNNYSTETTSEYENNKTNNNLICDKSIPRIVKPKSARATPIRSRATTPTSKFCHTITHAQPSSRPITRQSSQISLGLTKKDNNTSKSYPNAFTVLPSPVVSAPPTPKISKRKFFDKNAPDAYDAMESDWIIPPPDKLMEANSHKMKSLPTSPIITNKIKIGSENRIPTATTKSHRKLAFAIINEHKGRRHKLEHRHSEDNISGRLSPYTRYRLQREYLHLRSLSPESAPPLHTIDLLSGEFDPYVYDEYNQDEQDGRKTSIGFIHKRALSSSAINLIRRPRSVHPERKHREQDIRYQSTPNFVKLNKKSLTTQQQHKHIYFPILKRKQKGIVQVYSNTHVMRKTFSLDNITLADEEPPSVIDRNLLTPMPIDMDAKRHKSLIAHQKESRRKRKAMKGGLSPIVGTPNKDEKPGRKRMTDRERREMFGLVAKRQPKKVKEEDHYPVGDEMLGMGMATNLFAAPPPSKKMNAIRNITSLLGRKKETGPPPPTTPAKPKAADSLVSQMMARNVLARNLKARAAAKEPPKPLTKQPSKQSILSVDSTGSGAAAAAPEGGLKKKGSFASLKSISRSIRTVASMTSHRSSSIDEEAAEAADQVPVLESEKKDLKKKMQSGMSKLTLTNRLVPKQSRVTSAKGAKTKDPAPSRTASKASLRSVAASAKTVDSALSALGENQSRPPSANEPPQPTPSKAGKEKLVPLSKFSIASMTTAAITSQPLAVTTTITNELARQGAEKKEAAVAASVASSATEKEAATSQKAETQSISSIKTMASIRTLTSRKTDSKPSSRKTSAKKQERATSSRPGSRIFISAANTAMAVRAMMKSTRSNDSIDSIHSDATQITLGQGNGADNQDVPSVHLSDNQDTVSMRTSRLALSRHSTKLDMQTPARQAAQGASSTHLKTSHSKTSLMADSASINAINVMQETDLQMQEQMMMEEDEDEYEEDEDMGSAPDMQDGMEMSSSMNDVSRKRRWCGSLCACCDRTASEEDVNDDQPKTCGQKFCNCCCLPFRKLCLPFKRRRRNDGTAADPDKPSFWQRLCCCSSCCRKKKDGQKDPKKAKSTKSANAKEPGCFRSCLSRLNCFKCCKPCCGRMSDCCCGCCKKKTPSTMALQKKEQRAMDQEEKPGLCKRIFCCCCLKCGSKKPPPPIQRRGDSIVSDPRKQRSCCYRMLSKIFCCCMKKDEDSRRTSMLSKKQSLAPTIPPPEDNKPKLDMTLVEHASIMKGAIPVLPIFLAWWCLIFNIFIPGTGTIFSGFFCLCLGIPRFSQHDRIRARIGAFVINCIVGVSQAFTIIFCLVGWGWSIWWGTTMLNLARKHKKMKDAELNNNEQAETGTISTKSSQPVRKQPSSKDRDVEAGKK